MTSANNAARLADTVLDRSVLGGYPRWGLALRRRLPGWPDDPPADALRGRTALVTGANSGLGKATAAGLARLGATVHLVVRDTAKGEEAREERGLTDARVWRCDVGDLEDVRRFAGEFSAAEPALDVLVHNAGVLPPERQTSSGHEQTLATHVLGPLRMTESLRPRLHGGRVIIVSSGGMYTQKLPADLEYREGRYRGATAYARTKRVQVALLPILAERWAADQIGVYGTHPGWADTPGVADSLPGFHRLTGRILRDPDEGADTTVWLAATRPAPPGGLFWHDRRPRPESVLPWTKTSAAQRKAVWDYCARAAGIEEGVR
ncbi:SDR family NAD(P)-dependent oxidoreductase [Amycolatopsis acidicola]|uniref:SDR family NAD(P)-dependent oxidoreductase n=1 Tax=Amycolatopsis acidicola TaxID=2596893 RepID=A0A5N0VLH0_9PSEU|nr:SDR family NAD(P)-dependent oxidoreductase [Amycolatopsis acidicola]KAA9166383.1 SDR family NAD(P)-dependent oxidoreductase [Amycolatopsis acidicola]